MDITRMEIDTINNYYVEGSKYDLERATERITNIRKEIKKLRYNGVNENDKPHPLLPIDVIGDTNKLNYKIKTEVILYAVSDMSIPLTKRHDAMKEEYLKKCDSKKEAQNEFLKEYYTIHKPYDRIKSACWKTLFVLAGLTEDGEIIRN